MNAYEAAAKAMWDASYVPELDLGPFEELPPILAGKLVRIATATVSAYLEAMGQEVR